MKKEKDIYTIEYLRRELYGKKGTPKRDEVERELEAFREKTREDQEKELNSDE